MKVTDFEEIEDIGRCVIHTTKGEPTDAVLLLAGPDHPITKALDKRTWRQAATEVNRSGGKPKLETDVEQLFNEETDRLVARTLGWENFQDVDGNQMPFSPDGVRKFYANPKLFVREQVQRFLAAKENFTKRSSASS